MLIRAGKCSLISQSCLLLIVAVFFVSTHGKANADLKGMLKKAGDKLGEAESQINEITNQFKGGENVDDLVKQANKDLRTAQNDMFNGKKDKAVKGVKEVGDVLYRIKKADPNHKDLKSLLQKTDKLRRDLENRTGQKIVLKTDPPATEAATATSASSLQQQQPGVDAKPASSAASASPAQPTTPSNPAAAISSSAKPDRLPGEAHNMMQKVGQQLSSLEGNMDRVPTARADMQGSLIMRAEMNLKQVEDLLPKAKAEAAKRGVTEHPSFTEAESRLAADKQKFAVMRQQVEQAAAAEQAMAGEIENDAQALKAEYDRLRDQYFDKATGTAAYYNDLAPAEELLALIEQFEQQEKDKVQATLDQFAAKYGGTKEEIEAKTGDWQPASTYVLINEGIANVSKTRTAMAEDLIGRAKSMIDVQLGNLSHDFFIMETIARIRSYIELANRYASENAKVIELRSSFDDIAKQKLAENLKRIDERKWPGHSANAPKNADSLAKAALEWFKNDEGWGKRAQNPDAKDKEPRQPLAVAITGPWSVQKTNLLGQPVMYGLPALVAVQLEREKKDNFARVYIVTLRTQEMANPKMEPPFTSITVGDSYYIRPSNIK